MKKYKDFISEEIALRGNQGIPDDFIGKTDTKAQRDLRIRKDDESQMMQYGPEIMRLLQKSQQLTYGGLNRSQVEERMVKIEELAKKVILSEYETILNNVDLDIKLVRPGKASEDIPEMCDVPQIPPKVKLDDPEIRKEIDKAKLANNIIQGEAKNTKNILHSDIVKDGLREIFGQWEEIFKAWDDITKVADKLDWIIPIDIKADAMKNQPQFMAGAVKVEWGKDEEEEVDEEKEKKDLADKILKSLEEGEDLEDNEEDTAELFSTGNPKIIARGVDFPMLLHETVKGIYELIAAVGIPENEETAEIVKMNVTSFEDEAEDFRYGPYVASALRDFVNNCDGSDKYPNTREHVFGKMMALPADDFLKLMKGILDNKPEAKKKITEIITEINESISEWEIGEIESKYDDDDDTLTVSPDEDPISEPTVVEPKDIDYSSMSKRELNDALNDALDRSDRTALDKISKILQTKESVMWKVYGSDINKILKNK